MRLEPSDGDVGTDLFVDEEFIEERDDVASGKNPAVFAGVEDLADAGGGAGAVDGDMHAAGFEDADHAEDRGGRLGHHNADAVALFASGVAE
jgi:hypothetical protein